MGINSLNRILPDMCKAKGLRRKTACCLGVTCASSLFNAVDDSKLIRDRTGHRSHALVKYEKALFWVRIPIQARLRRSQRQS